MLAAQQVTIDRLQAEVKQLKRRAEGAVGESLCKVAVAEQTNALLKRNHRDVLASATRTARNLATRLECCECERDSLLELMEDIEADRCRDALSHQALRAHAAARHEHDISYIRAEYDKRLDRLRQRLQDGNKAMATAMAAADGRVAAIQAQVDDLAEEYKAFRSEIDRELESDGAEESTEFKRDYKALYETLAQAVGLVDQLTLPTRNFTGDPDSSTAISNWKKRSIRHLSACLAGRGEGAHISNIFDALVRCGYKAAFLDLPGVRRLLAQQVNACMKAHWTARLSVHIWDRLDLSRDQMETLRHLLSYVYDPVTDSYEQIKVWRNENNPGDFVLMAALPARSAREADYRRCVERAEIQVSSSGACERDAVQAASILYSNDKGAMRKNFTEERCASP